MVRIVGYGAAYAALGLALVWLGGGQGVAALLVGFTFTGYLLWRAWPAVHADVQRLAGSAGRVRLGRRRGARAGDGLL